MNILESVKSRVICLFLPNHTQQVHNDHKVYSNTVKPQKLTQKPFKLSCVFSEDFDLAGLLTYMSSRKGPKVGQGMLDFVEDIFVGVKLH